MCGTSFRGRIRAEGFHVSYRRAGGRKTLYGTCRWQKCFTSRMPTVNEAIARWTKQAVLPSEVPSTQEVGKDSEPLDTAACSKDIRSQLSSAVVRGEDRYWRPGWKSVTTYVRSLSIDTTTSNPPSNHSCSTAVPYEGWPPHISHDCG